MSSSELYKQIISDIEEGLKKIPSAEQPASIYEPYRYAMSVGGKRIRPLLCLLAAGLCSGDTDDALPAALAVEVLHNFTLVHDDIMDAAETRRGKASVYKKWNENVAILSGDIMFADALRQLEWYAEDPRYSKAEYAAIVKTFVDAAIIVCEGQALDLDFAASDEISIADYLHMIEGKTSALISASLKLGAVAARTTDENRTKLAQMGSNIGKAFQIQDDLLDATADPEKFGKKQGGDIYEGKKTFLSLLALERADGAQKRVISSTLGNRNSGRQEVAAVIELYHDLDVIDDVQAEVHRYYDEALNLLYTFDKNEYHKEIENLLLFLRNRDY